mmetsp:Transcript_9696/g.28996  ORF Transcript_9696/g.28996 Transcript_9696/m.28996 type:complete len:155 (-) Transcript_9696:23-487(-)
MDATEEDVAMADDASAAPSRKEKPAKLTRDEKDALAKWAGAELRGDKQLRATWLQTKNLSRARSLLLARARGTDFQAAAECLKHPATAADIVKRACAAAGPKGPELAAHWAKLETWAKGSRKLVARREKPKKNAGRPLGFRGKHKKHQSRHHAA